MSISAGEHPARDVDYIVDMLRSALRNGLDESNVSCIYRCDGLHAKGAPPMSPRAPRAVTDVPFVWA